MEKANKLRALFKEHNISAYIVPTQDQHTSEYIADCDQRRAYVSGFTGSAGTVVVTNDKALLWTDGRYFIQAEKQLAEGWTLMKAGNAGVPLIQVWLGNNIKSGENVGVDPRFISGKLVDDISAQLKPKNANLIPIEKNLIDQIWDDQPPLPKNKAIVYPSSRSGSNPTEKIAKLRENLKNSGNYAFVVTALDEVAYLFDLRGNDIQYNPVFFAYAVVSLDWVKLYIEDYKLDDQSKAHLGKDIQILPYGQVFEDLKAMSNNKSKPVQITTAASWAISLATGAAAQPVAISPVAYMKTIKNDVEIEGLKQCHIRDGVALCHYFAWLEEEIGNKNNNDMDEVDIADYLENLRKQQKDFVDLSFDTISSTGPNGAIIHYKPEKGACAKVVKNQLYLCDSGGQYLDGTTDVTRTLHFGTPSEREKRCFTRVLQGFIDLELTKFPTGTTGFMLDIIARAPLWKEGLNYLHGTGHGVGAYLNVHEGPQGISPRIAVNDVPFQAGMTVTNEPGYYEAGGFGIRIENVMITKNVELANNFNNKGYLGFESITFCPIQQKMIEWSLLSQEQIDWLNHYHKLCFEKLSPQMDENSAGYKWLQRETAKH